MPKEKSFIDANVLIKVCELAKTETEPSEDCVTALDLCIELFKQAPTVDAVEVVRCKDCKKAKEAILCDFICTRNEVMMPMNADDFCSYGERRTDNA